MRCVHVSYQYWLGWYDICLVPLSEKTSRTPVNHSEARPQIFLKKWNKVAILFQLQEKKKKIVRRHLIRLDQGFSTVDFMLSECTSDPWHNSHSKTSLIVNIWSNGLLRLTCIRIRNLLRPSPPSLVRRYLGESSQKVKPLQYFLHQEVRRSHRTAPQQGANKPWVSRRSNVTT